MNTTVIIIARDVYSSAPSIVHSRIIMFDCMQLLNSLDATLILAVILLLWGDLLPMLRTVVSIIMQECITMMVVNASSA